MKRPQKIKSPHGDLYRCTDIDPLLDELVRLKAEEIRNNTYPNKIGREAYRFSADGTFYCNPVEAEKKPFPSWEEFEKWYQNKSLIQYGSLKDIYEYFSQFCYETKVYPKVGDMVEGESIHSGITERGEIDCTVIKGRRGNHFYIKNIRFVITPTREEVIAKYGLTDSDLKALGFDNNLINWIIENTENVTGQDGVKWNCIERDELLNYLKG